VQTFRFGIATPILMNSNLSGFSRWELDAGPSELEAIAASADRLGFHFLTSVEHVGVGPDTAAKRGPRFYDSLATLAWLGALTRNIHLLTYIVVLPYHHPLAVAKRFGTLDLLSRGRLILGLGVGSVREEYELLGKDFDSRGAIYTEALKALRASMGTENPSFHGTYYNFENIIVNPTLRKDTPIWLGGRTFRSLARAVEFGDGWVPFGLEEDSYRVFIARAKQDAAMQRRNRPFEFVLPIDVSPDVNQAKERGDFLKMVENRIAVGATMANLNVLAHSFKHYLEQLEWLAFEVFPMFGVDQAR